MRTRDPFLMAALLLLLLLPSPAAGQERETPLPPGIRRQLDILFRTIAGGTPKDADQAVEELRRLGRPVMQELLAVLQDPTKPRLQRACAQLLGELGEPAAIEPLIAALPTADEATQLEMAIALCRLGSGSGVTRLIDLLAGDDPLMRLRAISQLHRFTHQRFGFRFNGDADSRAAAILTWKRWWEQHRGNFRPVSGIRPDPARTPQEPVRRGRGNGR